MDAKTDPIDAKVISKYGEVVAPKPMATKSEHELKHGALVARCNQLLELVNQENNRLKQSWDDDAKRSSRDVLEVLKKQLKSIDSRLAKMLQADRQNQRAIEIPARSPANDSLVAAEAKCAECCIWQRSSQSATTRRSKRFMHTSNQWAKNPRLPSWRA